MIITWYQMRERESVCNVKWCSTLSQDNCKWICEYRLQAYMYAYIHTHAGDNLYDYAMEW